MSQTKPAVYLTTWCPYCTALVADLDRAGIDYEPVDVDTDAEAAEFVKSVNGGNRVVPTVRFADGSTLTNPDVSEVAALLG
ncbi:mycoredoxin Mrx1 [Mariniluteicoccus endophyticus]